MSLLLTILAISPFVILGFIVFAGMAYMLTSSRRNEDELGQYESEYSTRQLQRHKEMTNVLKQIGGPKRSDGKFTDEQNCLWEQYLKLEQEDVKLSRLERDHIVNLRMRY